MFIRWDKITFPAPPHALDDDAARNRGVVRRPHRTATTFSPFMHPPLLSLKTQAPEVCPAPAPSSMDSTSPNEHAKLQKNMAASGPRPRTSVQHRHHLLSTVYHPTSMRTCEKKRARAGQAPGCYMALFQYLYHPNIPLPRPCGRYRVPGQTYARTV